MSTELDIFAPFSGTIDYGRVYRRVSYGDGFFDLEGRPSVARPRSAPLRHDSNETDFR